MTNLNKWIFTQEQDSGGFIISVMNFGLDRAMCFCTHLTKKKKLNLQKRNLKPANIIVLNEKR